MNAEPGLRTLIKALRRADDTGCGAHSICLPRCGADGHDLLPSPASPNATIRRRDGS